MHRNVLLRLLESVQDLEGLHRVSDLKTFALLSSKKVEICKYETMQTATNRTENNLVYISLQSLSEINKCNMLKSLATSYYDNSMYD
jgi:hypothetical protein